jgi:flagellar FliJ protein
MAARFRFRLESLLKLRHSLEQVAQRSLARALELQGAIQDRLAELQQSQVRTVEARHLPDHQPVDLELWRAVERYLLALERRVATARTELREAEARVAVARRELMSAHRAHLMLVRLKERRQAQHAMELLREEARDMDEMAVLRHRLSASLNEWGPRGRSAPSPSPLVLPHALPGQSPGNASGFPTREVPS